MSVAYIANKIIARVDQTCTASATHHVKWNMLSYLVFCNSILHMHVLSVDSTCFDKLELLKFFILVFITTLTNSLK